MNLNGWSESPRTKSRSLARTKPLSIKGQLNARDRNLEILSTLLMFSLCLGISFC